MTTAKAARPVAKKAPARKAPAPRIGELERAVVEQVAKAKAEKILTTPRDHVTAAILRSTARAADKALDADDRREYLTLVAEMRELVAVLGPTREGGGNDDGDLRGDALDRELAGMLGSGPEVHHSKNSR